MHSNFITPPDFVDEQKHTVTVVNATEQEVELLVKLCQSSDITYNIYLYRDEMNDTDWLDQAIKQSNAVIVNANNNTAHENLYQFEHTYFYGDKIIIAPAKQTQGILDYFYLTEMK